MSLNTQERTNLEMPGRGLGPAVDVSKCAAPDILTGMRAAIRRVFVDAASVTVDSVEILARPRNAHTDAFPSFFLEEHTRHQFQRPGHKLEEAVADRCVRGRIQHAKAVPALPVDGGRRMTSSDRRDSLSSASGSCPLTRHTSDGFRKLASVRPE